MSYLATPFIDSQYDSNYIMLKLEQKRGAKDISQELLNLCITGRAVSSHLDFHFHPLLLPKAQLQLYFYVNLKLLHVLLL